MKRKAIQSFKLENVSFTYEDSNTLIFEDITIDLPTSKAVWIRAPGNRGKSTLLRLLAGLLTPQSGRYLINGEDVNEMSFEEFLAYRISMGYGFDYGGLMNNKTLFENLALPLQYHKLLTPEEISERITSVMEFFGMSQAQGQRPYAVSGSQRKLTCVIRAFVHWPQIVFMDDPVTGLKADNLKDLIHYVEEGFASRGLRQMFFTGESSVLAEHFKAEELLISTDWFTTRLAAAAAA